MSGTATQTAKPQSIRVANAAPYLFLYSHVHTYIRQTVPRYDDGGLLKAVKAKLRGSAQETDFVTGISYNPKGQRERIGYGNGAKTKYEYDEKTFRLTRLLTTRNNGADKLQDLSYAYDQMGNITEITDEARQSVFFNGQAANPSQAFEYDALYRLIKATGREHVSVNADTEPETEGCNPAQVSPEDGSAMRLYARQWEHDEAGNILKLIHQANNNSWARDYNYGSANNRLNSTSVGQTTVNYAYNAHGSMTSMPHLQSMEWDFAERLNHVARGTTEAYYNYDGSGQRTRKVVEKGNIVEERLYLGGLEIFRKKVGNNLELERETLHIMDDKRRIAVTETLTVSNGTAVNNPVPVQRYQFSNNIESATLELDEASNIISYEEYYPYGETSYRAGRNASEVSQKRYRYTGKEKDEESGLYYYGARYYACWLGRWTAADPAGLVDGLNLYMYCRGSPAGLTDNTGKSSNLFDPDNTRVKTFKADKQSTSPFLNEDKNQALYSTDYKYFVEFDPTSNIATTDDKSKERPISNENNIQRVAENSSIFVKLNKFAYSSPKEAAIIELNVINPKSIEENREYGSTVCKVDGKYYATEMKPGTESNVTPDSCPIGEIAAYMHTHGRDGLESFSDADVVFSYNRKKTNYVITPGGTIIEFTPPKPSKEINEFLKPYEERKMQGIYSEYEANEVYEFFIRHKYAEMEFLQPGTSRE